MNDEEAEGEGEKEKEKLYAYVHMWLANRNRAQIESSNMKECYVIDGILREAGFWGIPRNKRDMDKRKILPE